MDWVLGVGVGLALSATLAMSMFERRRLAMLPVIDDEALARRCPAGIAPERWVAARRDLGWLIRMPSERLDPESTFDSLYRHLVPFGYVHSHLDFDTLAEEWEDAFGKGSFSLELRVGDAMRALIDGSIPCR